MAFYSSFYRRYSGKVVVALTLLSGLYFSSLQAATAPAHFPKYQCKQATQWQYCQSFNENTAGLQLLAANDAAAGLPNGSLILNTQRQSLSYKAARTGGQVLAFDDAALAGLNATDYYYEALIRPYANSTTDRETLYLTLKDTVSGNYYAAGFKVGSSVYTSKLELAQLPQQLSQSSQVQVLAEQALPLVLGAQDKTDGQWYQLRIQRKQASLQLYFNGEKVLSVDTAANLELQPAGVWSYNRSFELDYLAVGNGTPAHNDLSIELQQMENQLLTGYQHEQSDTINWQVKGTDAADISVQNLTPELFSIDTKAQSFRLNYKQPGQGAVLLQSKSQPQRFKQLNIKVLPALRFPSKTDSSVIASLIPVPQSVVSADSVLQLQFNQPFTLAENGAARIYQLQGDTAILVDEVKAGAESDAFGSAIHNKYRSINRPMIWQNGNTLLIKPHSGKLKPGQYYQVQLAAGLVSFVAGNKGFNGVGADADWRFSIKATPQAKAVMRVAADGSGDFTSLQGALDFVMSAAGVDKVTTISLAAGLYPEPLYLYGVKQLTIAGEGASRSNIAFTNYESLNSGLGMGYPVLAGHTGGGRSLFMVEDVEQLVISNLSITNLHQRKEGVRNQAEALYFNSTGKLLAHNSHFTSEQDTLMLKGIAYFYRNLIAGNVDFIWGQNYLSLFEQNEIRSVGNSVKDPQSEYAEGSYILQARTVSKDAPGFIFLNNRFTSYPGPTGNIIRPGSTFIARSAGRAAYIDNVLMLNNQLDKHISAQGWAGPVDKEPVANPAEPGTTSGWREYGSTDLQGKALNTSERRYGRVLTTDELPYSSSDEILRLYWPGFDKALLTEPAKK